MQKKKKETEENLLNTNLSNRFIQNILDAIPIAMFYKDSQARFVGCNKAYEEAFGVKREDIVGKKVTEIKFHSKKAREYFHKEDLYLLKNNVTVAKELDIIFKDGVVHNTLYSKSAFKVSDNASGLIGTVIDISDKIKFEKELAEAKQKAEDATRNKTYFLAAMSHEIKTPLNAIIGYSQLLEQTPLDNSQKEYLKKVETSARVLLSLLNDILDFTKISEGKVDIEQIEFDINEVVDTLQTLIADRIEKKGLMFEYKIVAGIPAFFIGDPLRIEQILLNFLTNAVKFTEKGKISLTIKGKPVKDNKFLISFSVIDRGIGLTKEQIKKVFEAFTQADGSTTRKYGGTGLGLSICQSLTDLMGGEINVKSSLGKGSTFELVLTLPVAAEGKQVSQKNNQRIITKSETKKVLNQGRKIPAPEVLDFLQFVITPVENNDFEAVKHLNNFLNKADEDLNSEFSALKKSLANYDFDNALKELKFLMKKYSKG